jgi:hypothetical protein
MEAGEVGFYDEKAVRRMKVASKNGPLLRKLEKSREERFPDLRQEREDRDAEEARKLEHERREKKANEQQSKKELQKKAAEEAALREYRDIFSNDEAKTVNKENRSQSWKMTFSKHVFFFFFCFYLFLFQANFTRRHSW